MRIPGQITATGTTTASDGDVLWAGTAGDTGTASGLVNNNKSAVGFIHTDTKIERYNLPALNYGGSNGIDIEIIYSAAASGSVSEGVRFDVGYDFTNSGGALGTETSSSVTLDVSSYTADDQIKIALVTIPHGDVDADAELITCSLQRDHDHVDDNFANTLYVHRVRWVQASA